MSKKKNYWDDKAIDPPKNKKCVHHWVIDIANGPVSKGICKYCKIKQEFVNSLFTKDLHLSLKKDNAES
jgi:hypothetical protein